MEIRVTAMKANDEITIRTCFSDYCFRVMDPVECKGVLSGGLLGTEPHEAVFIETIRSLKTPLLSTGQIEPGGRAVFLVGTDGLKRLTTSTITDIAVSEPSEASPEDC